MLRNLNYHYTAVGMILIRSCPVWQMKWLTRILFRFQVQCTLNCPRADYLCIIVTCQWLMTKVEITLFFNFFSGIPKANKNHGLFTYTIIVCSLCVMYIINILQLYCLFVAQWSVRSGLHVSLNYPCTPSPTLPRIIDSTRHFVSLTRYAGNAAAS